MAMALLYKPAAWRLGARVYRRVPPPAPRLQEAFTRLCRLRDSRARALRRAARDLLGRYTVPVALVAGHLSVHRGCSAPYRVYHQRELRRGAGLALRRLMCNSGQRRRSPDRMLHQTLSKGWCHARSRLLLGLIVRPRGRLVEARSRFAAAENRSPCPAQRSGGHHPGYPRPVAALPQREGLLEIRPLSPALLLPESVLPESVQPAGKGPGARDASSAACLRPRTR